MLPSFSVAVNHLFALPGVRREVGSGVSACLVVAPESFDRVSSLLAAPLATSLPPFAGLSPPPAAQSTSETLQERPSSQPTAQNQNRQTYTSPQHNAADYHFADWTLNPYQLAY